jgi:hypothetical protein
LYSERDNAPYVSFSIINKKTTNYTSVPTLTITPTPLTAGVGMSAHIYFNSRESNKHQFLVLTQIRFMGIMQALDIQRLHVKVMMDLDKQQLLH